ncbi:MULTISPECIES: type II toxin-antitoxin system RelE/ParE family toxin [unclassified Endozoicomonas]|uniref:type II toxin-antitoxin system RelE/ParE family toxin n=1 Tax=unclassified Endozoicomonas TaxID=2644528 RepID=UPI003BB5688F
MTRYHLSVEAGQDIERIFEFGLDCFGYEQASRYLDGLETHLNSLARHPNHYPAIRHIREGYRRSVYGVHAVYYSELDDGVLIVRILGRQDFVEALNV